MTDSSHRPARSAFARAVPALLLLLSAGLLVAAGCGPGKIERQRSVFDRPLAALADSGQVEAMRVVADIEVLRAQGMFTDSLANSLTELPASEYMTLDEKGALKRVGRGVDLTALVDYLAVEPQLLQEMVISREQASELRRLAMDNMAAAAEMAAGFTGQRAGTPQ